MAIRARPISPVRGGPNRVQTRATAMRTRATLKKRAGVPKINVKLSFGLRPAIAYPAFYWPFRYGSLARGVLEAGDGDRPWIAKCESERSARLSD